MGSKALSHPRSLSPFVSSISQRGKLRHRDYPKEIGRGGASPHRVALTLRGLKGTSQLLSFAPSGQFQPQHLSPPPSFMNPGSSGPGDTMAQASSPCYHPGSPTGILRPDRGHRFAL